jgi:DNA-binding transcriptional MerR regulator
LLVDKAPEAFLTIGEMAQRLGVKTHILRYWEEQFPMLKPLTRAGGRRLYRPTDVALLQQINDLLHRQGYTIKGARQFLQKGSGVEAVAAPAPMSAFSANSNGPELAFIRDELNRVRNRLSAALADA